jgi:LmbE family N-acetylglucosaminyl deacetylase
MKTIKIRPHYHLKGHDVYFLASNRPIKKLNNAEKNLFDDVKINSDGVNLSALSTENISTLESLLDAGFADILTPVAQHSEHHLVVIEPHMDDAILSAGGQLLLRKGKCRITILCVFGISNYTSYMEAGRAYLDSRGITQLRHDESILAASQVGADFLSLGFSDAPLRMQAPAQWTEAFLTEDIRESHGFISTHPMPHVVNHISAALTQSLRALEPDEVWIPMGLGNHLDHKTTRSACLKTLSSTLDFKSSLSIQLYEDLPYSRPAHCAQILKAFEDAGTQLVMKTVDISEVFDLKMKAVGVFSSQFKLSMMAPRLERAASEVAKSAGFACAGERCYGLQRPFQIPNELELSVNRDASLGLNETALNFAKAVLRQKTITILVLPSGILGALPELTKALAHAFPDKKIEINSVRENHKANEKDDSNNIATRYYLKKSVSMALLLARVFLSIGQPLVIVRCAPHQRSFMNRLIYKSLDATRILLTTPSLPDLAAYWETATEN